MARDLSVNAFEDWAVQNGAIWLEPKTEWEFARFTAQGAPRVIYQNKKGDLSFSDEFTRKAWGKFKVGHAATLGPKKRDARHKAEKMRKIVERDGEECFFCGVAEFTGADAMTLEHLVPKAHHGPNHMSNLVIAHASCNVKAGNLSAAEKVRLRDEMRKARNNAED